MGKKIVLITGASRGLGYELAKRLGNDHIVYSGVRDSKTAPSNTFPIHLDMTRERTIETCVETILSEQGKIDILIHNAAIAYYGAVDTMTLSEVRQLFETNFFGIFRLTQLVIPHMRKQKNGTVLFVSSIRGVESCAFMGMYSASKAALEAMAFDWAVTLRKWNILVSIVQPGPMDTKIDIKSGTYFKSDQENPYLPYPDVALQWQPVEEAAQVIIDHLPNPPFRFQTNQASQKIIEKHLQDPSGHEWFQQELARLI